MTRRQLMELYLEGRFFLKKTFYLFYFEILYTHTCSYKLINTFTTSMNTFERLSGKYWDWWNQHKSTIGYCENIWPLNFSRKILMPTQWLWTTICKFYYSQFANLPFTSSFLENKFNMNFFQWGLQLMVKIGILIRNLPITI